MDDANIYPLLTTGHMITDASTTSRLVVWGT